MRPKTFTYLQPLILFPYNCTVSCGGAQQQFVVQGAEWRLEEETQEHTLSSEIYTSPFPLQCTMNWLSGSGDFWCNARWHYWFIQDSITRMWTWSVGGVWSILAEHFVGFRLIDSPWKIYQHSRLWNILLDKWKWMMQVPCCNIWISEKKVVWKLFGPLDPWFLSNMKNFVLLLGRLYVGIQGDKRGWVGPHLCLTVY